MGRRPKLIVAQQAEARGDVHSVPRSRNLARSYGVGKSAEHVEGAARAAVNARYRHNVAGGEGSEHFEKLAPVAMRACDLLAVNLVGAACGAQLLKLAVERLAHGADAGIAETVILRVSFGHILRERDPLIGQGQENLPKLLNCEPTAAQRQPRATKHCYLRLSLGNPFQDASAPRSAVDAISPAKPGPAGRFRNRSFF